MSAHPQRTMRTRRIALFASITGLTVVLTTAPASAHEHEVTTGNGRTQVLANGQNHPSFGPVDENGLRHSCAGILEPGNSGPAGYGLETAHHGPHAGTPGKADGCYAARVDADGNLPDNNPAVD